MPDVQLTPLVSSDDRPHVMDQNSARSFFWCNACGKAIRVDRIETP